MVCIIAEQHWIVFVTTPTDSKFRFYLVCRLIYLPFEGWVMSRVNQLPVNQRYNRLSQGQTEIYILERG